VGSVIRVSIPYVKADIPILVLFRALGTVVRVSVCGCFWGQNRKPQTLNPKP
jgi:hypothetical protein